MVTFLRVVVLLAITISNVSCIGFRPQFCFCLKSITEYPDADVGDCSIIIFTGSYNNVTMEDRR